MKTKEITNKQQWNTFVKKHGPRSGAFLHAWGWGELQTSQGKDVKRLGFFEKETLVGVAGLIRFNIGVGFYYWYCPRGPIISKDTAATTTNSVFRELKHELKGANALRFDAPIEGSLTFGKNVIRAPHDVQPRATILLDLTKNEKVLLDEMHKKTRYNIRLSERHDVCVAVHGIERIADFWKLLKGTTERDAFRSHPKAYYAALLDTADDGELDVFLAIASKDDVPIAAAIMADFAGTRTYLHGASDYENRDVMGPYGLHWFLIENAKSKGLKRYDLWGIAPTDRMDEKLRGVTRFKRGFGGEEVLYARTRDLILQPFKYRFYRLAHKILT